MHYNADYKEMDQEDHCLNETVLDNVEKIKYLGITITNDMKWNTHVSNICTKANRTLGFLRGNLTACPQDVKELAYKGLVCPVLEYGSSVWKKRRQDSRLIMFYKGLKGANGNKVYKWMTLYQKSSLPGISNPISWDLHL